MLLAKIIPTNKSVYEEVLHERYVCLSFSLSLSTPLHHFHFLDLERQGTRLSKTSMLF